jgi:hypothetical protein
MKPVLAACLLLATLPGCQRAEEPGNAASAVPSAAEDAAAKGQAAFEDAVAKENWPLAKAQADVLMAQYPGTRAAQAVEARYAEVKDKAEALRENARTAALWLYQTQPVTGGQQLSASIQSKEGVDTDGSGAKPVKLIFRDHPDWGRSSYLVLQGGDFDCYGGCRVQVRVDDQPAKAMAASRPKTDEAIAMFIEDEKALWRMTQDAKAISIEFPAKGQGKKTAVFEVGGLDRKQMPGWG